MGLDVRRFNIVLHTFDGEHHLSHTEEDVWEVTKTNKVSLLRLGTDYVGVNFKGHKTYRIGDTISNRVLTQITRDRNGRIFLTLSER